MFKTNATQAAGALLHCRTLHPAYNADRGAVTVASIRLHAQY